MPRDIGNVAARPAGLQDGAADLTAAATVAVVVDAAAVASGRVAAEGAVVDAHRRLAAGLTLVIDTAAVAGRVAADSAVAYGHCGVPDSAARPTVDAAADAGRVAAQGAVADRQRHAAVEPPLKMPPP